jgi:hypothetical protein
VELRWNYVVVLLLSVGAILALGIGLRIPGL